MNNTTTDLHPNDRVFHPKFGFGTILERDENGRLSVRFDHHGTKWLVLKYAQSCWVTAEEEARTALPEIVIDACGSLRQRWIWALCSSRMSPPLR